MRINFKHLIFQFNIHRIKVNRMSRRFFSIIILLTLLSNTASSVMAAIMCPLGGVTMVESFIGELETDAAQDENALSCHAMMNAQVDATPVESASDECAMSGDTFAAEKRASQMLPIEDATAASLRCCAPCNLRLAVSSTAVVPERKSKFDGDVTVVSSPAPKYFFVRRHAAPLISNARRAPVSELPRYLLFSVFLI